MTTYEKQQLDKLEESGRIGYFNRGKLVVLDDNSSGSKNARVYRHGGRRQVAPQANNTAGTDGEIVDVD